MLSKTTHSISFEKLSGSEFERLVFAYLSRVRKWDSIKWLGQTGSDGGVDILGVYKNETYCYQCANRQQLNFKKIKDDIDKITLNVSNLSFFTIVCRTAIGVKLRTTIESYASEKGIINVEIWSGVELEERIRREAPDVLSRFFTGTEFPEIDTKRFSGLSGVDKKHRDELLKGLHMLYETRRWKKMESEVAFQLNVQLKHTVKGTDEEFIEKNFVIAYEDESEKEIDDLLFEIENHVPRLLILGEPGGGKTMLLIEIARKALEKAVLDQNYPIPILLNLGTWRNEDQSFRTWLEQNLIYAAGQFGTTKRNALYIANNYSLMLLLDGLDEAPKTDRDSLIKELRKYIEPLQNSSEDGAGPRIVICSRIGDYEKMIENPPVKASLIISQLDGTEVKRQLFKKYVNDSVKRLYDYIIKEPRLLQYLTTPFQVHLILHLSQSILDNLDINKVHPAYFLNEYIDQELNKIGSIPKAKIERYMAKLSEYSLYRGSMSFELTDFQSTFCVDPGKLRYIRLLIAGICGAIGVAEFHIVLGLDIDYSLFIVVFFAIVTAAYYTYFGYSSIITPKEIREFKPTGRAVLHISTFTFILIVCSPLILKFANSVSDFAERELPKLSFSWLPPFVNDIIRGVSLGIYLPLYLIVPVGIHFLIRLAEQELFVTKRHPIVINAYYRFTSSYLFDFASMFFTLTVVSFVTSKYILHLNLNLFDSILVSLIASLLITIPVSFFYSPLAQHFILRVLIVSEKNLPFKLKKFLNAVSSTGLMEKNLGQWRFRHHLIVEHFALKAHLMRTTHFHLPNTDKLLPKEIDDLMILFVVANRETEGGEFFKKRRYIKQKSIAKYTNNLKITKRQEIGGFDSSSVKENIDFLLGLLCKTDERRLAEMLVGELLGKDFREAKNYVANIILVQRIDMSLESGRRSKELESERYAKIIGLLLMLIFLAVLYVINFSNPSWDSINIYSDIPYIIYSHIKGFIAGEIGSYISFSKLLLITFLLKLIVFSYKVIKKDTTLWIGSNYYDMERAVVLLGLIECIGYGYINGFTPFWGYLGMIFILQLPTIFVSALTD